MKINIKKIKINKKNLFAFLLSFSIGCTYSLINNKKELDGGTINFYKESDILDDKIKLSEIANEYIKYFENQNDSYNYNELYPTERDIDKLVYALTTKQECLCENNDDLTSIINKIKNNSIKYVNKHIEYQNAFVDEDFCGSISKLKNMQFEKAFKSAMKKMINKSSNCISEDLNRLNDYSIVFQNLPPSILGQHLSEYKLIIIDCDQIIKEANNYEDYMILLENSISHELNHGRQYSCDDRIKKGQNYKTISLNKPSFIIEASAESEIYNSGKDSRKNTTTYDYTYYEYRKQEALLLMLGMFNENNDIFKYYNSIFDSDLYEFYKFLGACSDKDMLDIYKIIYSIDAIYKRNSLYKHIDTSNKDLEECIGYNYKKEICKRVLIDMIEYTDSHDDYTLNDNLITFNILRDYIVSGKSQSNSDFIDSITKYSNEYLKFLASHYGYNYKEIKEKDILLRDNVYTTAKSLIENKSQTESAKRLQKRFPILKNIAFTYGGFSGSYYIYEKELKK